MSEVTEILDAIDQGDTAASDRLLPLVYEELRRLAAQKMSQERKDHTLQATALVHEAYVRLVDGNEAQRWNSRGHFFAAAAEAMRRILVEQARRKNSKKSGGDHQRVDLSVDELVRPDDATDLVAISEALNRLQANDPRAAELVKLRFFAGLTREQAADILGVSIATADNDWAYAKAWLQVDLS